MNGLGTGRYVLEWAGILGALSAVAWLAPGELLSAGMRGPAQGGIAVAGFADLVIFLAVGQALVACPERAVNRWMISLLGKLCFFGAGTGCVAWLAGDAYKPFLVALFVAFSALTAHQVVRLVKLADRTEETRSRDARA